MRGLAFAVLAVLILAPVGFLVWLNVNYWSGLSGHGTGWSVATTILDLMAFVGAGSMALLGLGALVEWAVDTLLT